MSTQYKQEYYLKHKEKIKARSRLRRNLHVDDIKLQRFLRGRKKESSNRIEKHGVRIKENKCIARKLRRKEDPLYRYKEGVTNALRTVVRRMKRGENTQPKYSKRYGCRIIQAIYHQKTY